ncbi:MAG: transglutaminase-like domain-containing protein [Rubripirellula sp.]
MSNYQDSAVGVLLLAFALSGASLPAEELSPAASITGSKSMQATYEVDFRVAVTAPTGTKKLRVWMPLPNSDACQQISDRQIETHPRLVEPKIATEAEYGNTFAYFEFDSPSGAQLITHRFKAQLQQLNWDVDYGEVIQPKRWPDSFAPFQKADPRSTEGDQLRQVLTEIDASTGESSAPDRLIGAMQWVDKNLVYDHKVASLSANPMHAMVHRRGHCSDYHGLCSTLARNVGYPSRVLYGLQMFDKGSPSHCKLEVFLPPYGWVSYDLSETQKLAAKTAQDESLDVTVRDAQVQQIKKRTMSGFRENTWLQVTRGVGYELAPRAENPISIVRTIYAEADGKPLVEPDPYTSSEFAWMTIHRVDLIDGVAKRFHELK